mmetsp:Transcript_73854/g.213740  ORF Transcript_73854/g.213740 Transcript_73854/m.213740 type:complete len:267 (+) Transcript_73854:172-972(+)
MCGRLRRAAKRAVPPPGSELALGQEAPRRRGGSRPQRARSKGRMWHEADEGVLHYNLHLHLHLLLAHPRVRALRLLGRRAKLAERLVLLMLVETVAFPRCCGRRTLPAEETLHVRARGGGLAAPIARALECSTYVAAAGAGGGRNKCNGVDHVLLHRLHLLLELHDLRLDARQLVIHLVQGLGCHDIQVKRLHRRLEALVWVRLLLRHQDGLLLLLLLQLSLLRLLRLLRLQRLLLLILLPRRHIQAQLRRVDPAHKRPDLRPGGG